MKYLFINGSPNPNGNTAALAAELLEGKNYKSLNLTDYTIGAYGQELPGDGLEAVIAAMENAKTIVIGSPVYFAALYGMTYGGMVTNKNEASRLNGTL